MQHLARAIDVPLRARLLVDVERVDVIAYAAHDAIVASGNDLGRARNALSVGDDRQGQEGGEIARRDARNRFALEAVYAYGRRQPYVGPRADRSAIAPRERKTPFAVDLVQRDNVTRVNQVRISDLLAIHSPDFGPAPGLLQKLSGNAPKRVALLHGVAVGRVVLKLEILRPGGRRREQKRQRAGRKQQRRYDRL
jgi:hypothetical protein